MSVVEAVARKLGGAAVIGLIAKAIARSDELESGRYGILIIVYVARTQTRPNRPWPAASQLQSSNCPGGFPGRVG